MEWAPTVRADVLNTAVPLVREIEPREVLPSLKVTVPPAVEGVTVAVKAMLCPKVDGLGEAIRPVDVVT